MIQYNTTKRSTAGRPDTGQHTCSPEQTRVIGLAAVLLLMPPRPVHGSIYLFFFCAPIARCPCAAPRRQSDWNSAACSHVLRDKRLRQPIVKNTSRAFRLVLMVMADNYSPGPRPPLKTANLSFSLRRKPAGAGHAAEFRRAVNARQSSEPSRPDFFASTVEPTLRSLYSKLLTPSQINARLLFL